MRVLTECTGGGFGGTIQVFVPEKKLDGFIKQIESVFGKGSCNVLNIRQDGGVLAVD